MGMFSKPDAVYLVGKYIDGEDPYTNYEFQGVFSDHLLAEAACRDENYWVKRFWLDRSLPHDTTPDDDFSRPYWPLRKDESEPVEGHA